MRSGCDDRKTVTFSTFGPGATANPATAVPDRCEMCGDAGPALECEMSGGGLSYRLYVCAGCGRELVEEVATVASAAKPAGAC